MATVSDTTLREYLRLQRRKSPPCIAEYDIFLVQLWTCFELRSAAEDWYDTKEACLSSRHLAKNRMGALPLTWKKISQVLNTGGPPEEPITRIAKNNFADVDELIRNLRKVLMRVREKVNIGRVQQIDAQCLRWLTRQPGRNAIEKAGSKQEILGVVRVENFNTLENRVLKDFLQRCFDLSSMYLRIYEAKHDGKWKDHAILKQVKRFRNLCMAGLSLEAMSSVRALTELPQPNYVLQQDRLYSKIWKSYCAVLRQEDVAEKLWKRRAEVDEVYTKCTNGVRIHCSPRAKFHTNIWFNDIDGKRDLVESPCWQNELGTSDIIEPDLKFGDVGVVDFAAIWDERTDLIYPADHPNAYPYIKNHRRPSRDRVKAEVALQNILIKEDDAMLKDYLRSYYGIVGGKEWVILTPDNWKSDWIDKVLRAKPAALLSSKIFMMWRSVAAVLGADNGSDKRAGDKIMVEDGYMFSFANDCLIKYVADKDSGRVLPQRASKILHGDDSKDDDCRFWLKRKFDNVLPESEIARMGASHLKVGCGSVGKNRHEILVLGALKYIAERDRHKVCYFDELDPLWLVVQNRAEEVEFKPLIKHRECHPGGTVYIGEKTVGGRLPELSTKVSLNLLWGRENDSAPLKQVEKTLDEPVEKASDISFEAKVTPGQGLATIMFSADFIDEPRPLELQNMKTSDLTKARIEREMKRHFPPVMPYVEASEDIWLNVRDETLRYMHSAGSNVDNGLFYHPQPYFGSVGADGSFAQRSFGFDRIFDQNTMSPIDKLKRENVFGNASGREYPDKNVNWSVLFDKLASDYRRNRDVLRLIAWTYQCKPNDAFEFIREDCFSRYVCKNETLSIVEYTFCANCFGKGDHRIAGIVEKVLSRIAQGSATENEYRLTYNLLQFHPESLENIDSELCKSAFNRVYHKYCTENLIDERGYISRVGRGQATKMVGYYLKCMLFLLHRRRFDSQFLHRDQDWLPKGILAVEIRPRRLPNGMEYPSQRAHADLRNSFLNYIRGNGTIEGIPLGD